MSAPRFLADEMLGTLARWLRMMGYDTKYARGLLDGEILTLASEEGRIILTRDRQLAERARDHGMLISSAVPDEQLENVVRAYGLNDDGAMTRCTLCNGQLQLVSKDAIAGKVPERVLSSHDEFYRCPQCGQVYWKGTHWDNIMKKMGRLAARCDSNPR
jgi:uncharacterized protein